MIWLLFSFIIINIPKRKVININSEALKVISKVCIIWASIVLGLMGYSYRKQIQAYHKNQKTHIPHAYEQELNLLQLYFSNKYILQLKG